MAIDLPPLPMLMLCLGMVSTPSRAADHLPPELPLGYPGLTETREETPVAPGLTYTRILRGTLSPYTYWSVELGFAPTLSEAHAALDALALAGVEARLDPAASTRPDGGPLGFMIRTGEFDSEASAEAQADALLEGGVVASARVRHTAEDGGAATGPWRVNVLEVDPAHYRGRLQIALGNDVSPGGERPSAQAARSGALAATNGGFFVFRDDLGVEGEPAGLALIDGRMLSESVDGRPALILDNRASDGVFEAGIARHVRSDIELIAGGRSIPVDGINRTPGLTLNCGNPGDEPLVTPAHDYLCTDADELVVFTRDFGPRADAGEGAEIVVIEATGEVIAQRPSRGGRIDVGQLIVQGTGEEAERLLSDTPIGARVRVTYDVTARSPHARHRASRSIPLTPGVYAVNGGPSLVEDGETVFDHPAEGWSPDAIDGDARQEFYNGWAVRRNPRTAAGVRADGTLVLVVVDGRDPDTSIGASVLEMAGLMQSLGAVDAMNLDGGGSSSMVVNGERVSLPSDDAGERPVSDTLLVLP